MTAKTPGQRVPELGAVAYEAAENAPLRQRIADLEQQLAAVRAKLADALRGRRIPVTIVDHAGGDTWLAEPVSPHDLAAQLIAATDPQNRPQETR
jgi:hypothetical protein